MDSQFQKLLSDEELGKQLLVRIIGENEKACNLSEEGILETCLNLLMKAERGVHLDGNEADKGNGYFERNLGTPSGKLELKVPRDRDGDFRPTVLPSKYARATEERFDLLKRLFAVRYSPNEIARLLRSMGLGYSPEELEKLKEDYLKEYDNWSHRQLPSDAIAIDVDAYHAQIMHGGKIRKAVVYVVLGIDFQAHKDLWGLYPCMGSENKEFWLQVFNDLLDRGLKRLLMVLSDDFGGLTESVQTLFPNAYHQLCYKHLQANVRRNMSKEDASAFIDGLQKIKLEEDFDSGMERFQALLSKHRDKYPHFIDSKIAQAHHYLAFLHLPKKVRRHLYTTNAVESYNSGLERMRNRMGGFFQSVNTFNIAAYVQYQQQSQRWSKGIPAIKSELYSLRQLFASVYGHLPHARE